MAGKPRVRVRPRHQGRQSEKGRFAEQSGGIHRGGASGNDRHSEERPGPGAAQANEPGSVRLPGQLETVAFL